MLQAGEGAAAATPYSRELQGLVSRHEQLILNAVVQRTPLWVAPDHLTAFGFLGAVLTALGAYLSWYTAAGLWLALVGLAVNWLGDSTDGALARYRRIERRRYGFFVDLFTDLSSQLVIMLGIGLSPYMSPHFAMLGLLGYLVMCVYTLLRLHVFREMQLAFFGVGPTEVRLMLAAGIVTALVVPVPVLETPVGPIALFDAAAGLFFVLAMSSLAVCAFRDWSVLSRLDPPRRADPIEIDMIEVRPRAGER